MPWTVDRHTLAGPGEDDGERDVMVWAGGGGGGRGGRRKTARA